MFEIFKVWMATDGSVNGLSGGAVAVLQDQEGRSLCIQILVDRKKSNLTSYKTELHAILGDFILLQRLVLPALCLTTSGVIWSDSKSALGKLGNISQLSPFLHKEALSTGFPIIAEINSMGNLFPNIRLEWVESHQKVKNLAQQLNAEANRVATLQHVCTCEWEN